MKQLIILWMLILASCDSTSQESDFGDRPPTGNDNPAPTDDTITLTFTNSSWITGSFDFVNHLNSGFDLEHMYFNTSRYVESERKTYFSFSDFKQSQTQFYMELHFYSYSKNTGTTQWLTGITEFELLLKKSDSDSRIFHHKSGSTTISVYENENGRIKGTFSAVIIDTTEPNTDITLNATFNVERREDLK